MPTAKSKLLTVALLVALVAAGCDTFRDSPESRAQLFLEILVREPGELARLNELVNPVGGGGPESVLDGLTAQLAVGYLRARHRQGMDLDFALTAMQRSDPNHRRVRVAVGTPAGRTRLEHDNRIRFEVALELSEQQGWRVTRVSAE
jgi:hypothetical protein